MTPVVGKTFNVPGHGQVDVVRYLGTRYKWGVWLVKFPGTHQYMRIDEHGHPVADAVTTAKPKRGGK